MLSIMFTSFSRNCVVTVLEGSLFSLLYSLREYVIYLPIFLVKDISLICHTNNVVMNFLVYISWCTCVRVSGVYLDWNC